jgi:2,4-dienoyl-CoA reductase-like NADH-dependent reductase (Old Yellow Enzyme family)
LGIGREHPCLTDSEIACLVEDFVAAAVRASRIGFDFVDIKHCHGYFGHEFLSAVDRPGRYGGSFENRPRICRARAAENPKSR